MANPQPNKPQSILELLQERKNSNPFRPTFSAEIIPPRNGSELKGIHEQLTTLTQAKIDFVSVTKGAGGSLRGGTLPIAQWIKQEFNLTAIAHFTCRDYSVEEIENNLMDHHYFGIDNILALRGDPPDGQPDYFTTQAPPQTTPRHQFAYQLVEQIQRMNCGKYLTRKGFDQPTQEKKGAPTNFCIGIAAHPEHLPLEQSIEYLKRKVDAGGQYAITQMIFDAEIYARFLEACAKVHIDIPILPGFRILTSLAMLERMQKKFQVHVPTWTRDAFAREAFAREAFDRDTASAAQSTIGLDCAETLSRQLLRYGAPGLHLFVMNDAVSSSRLIERLRS